MTGPIVVLPQTDEPVLVVLPQTRGQALVVLPETGQRGLPGAQGPEGPQGPIGPGGGATIVPFTFATPSPMILQAVTSANLINRAAIVVKTPFDDPDAFLELGTTTTPDLILGPGDVDPEDDSQYGTGAIIATPSSDLLILTISPGASTQGAGVLYYWIQ
jgi:hypothetical protein